MLIEGVRLKDETSIKGFCSGMAGSFSLFDPFCDR